MRVISVIQGPFTRDFQIKDMVHINKWNVILLNQVGIDGKDG